MLGTIARTLHSMTTASSVELTELLDEELVYDATTKSGLTNHLPMALVAKAGLGAGSDELRRFATAYRLRLVPIQEPDERLTRATWHRAIGRADAYPDLLGYFNREVRTNGVDATLRAHLDQLVDGVSGAGFHGVIRLAYALESDAPERISAGLAYFGATAMKLGPLKKGSPTSESPEQLLHNLSTDARWGSMESVRMISGRMRLVASKAEFVDVASALVVDEFTPRRLADAALKIYASTNDFTALHGVTGLEAISHLRPFVDDVQRLDRASYQALAAAFLTIGAPPFWSNDRLDALVASREIGDADVVTRAANSNDEHVAKVVYTATRRGRETGDPLYGTVAERAVRDDDSIDRSLPEGEQRC